MAWIDGAVALQRANLVDKLSLPLKHLAGACSLVWQDVNALDDVLMAYIQQVSRHPCQLLYAIKPDGYQVSANVSTDELDRHVRGQDLSGRPYIKKLDQSDRLFLSDVYVDKQTDKPCMTALHRVESRGQLLGYLAADFDLDNLPIKAVNQPDSCEWRQIKGDPSIRRGLFSQTRSVSPMDEHLDDVLPVVSALMRQQGIFHAKLHFSSSRATLWHIDDPCRYRIHVLDEILDPKVCLVYPKTPYPADALIDASLIKAVFGRFRQLREADETIYLRAASLNVMNGLVGLNFSCDGSHYMPADEFLTKGEGFWFGSNAAA